MVLRMNLQLLAYNGAIIPTLDDGFRLADDVTVQVSEDERTVRAWRTENPDAVFECVGQNLLCTIGEDGRMYLLDVFSVLQHLIELRNGGCDPVIPLADVIARFTR